MHIIDYLEDETDYTATEHDALIKQIEPIPDIEIELVIRHICNKVHAGALDYIKYLHKELLYFDAIHKQVHEEMWGIDAAIKLKEVYRRYRGLK